MTATIKILIGATAAGKTRWALDYAATHDVEIISADSMQIYRYMDIGTAKPSPIERKSVPHHLIDIVAPDQPFSVHDFFKHANMLVRDIRDRGKTPLIVGGTGLYINSFIRDFDFPVVERDPALRDALKQRAAVEGTEALYAELQSIDAESAARINRNDAYRIIRAIEVYYASGQPLSSYYQTAKTYRSDMELWHIRRPRAQIYRLIEERVDSMLKSGLIDEVVYLLDQGYDPGLPAMQALGYKEIVSYIQGNSTKEASITLIKQRTRNFAKRQLTWFRSFPVTRLIELGA